MEVLHPLYGTVIVLNGPRSAGKGTLPSYLCENLGEHHLHIELDASRPVAFRRRISIALPR